MCVCVCVCVCMYVCMYIYIYLYSSRLLGTFSDTWIFIVERNQKVTYVHVKNKVISCFK